MSRHENHPLTLEQAKKLLEAAKSHRLEALLTVALATGMRKGELLSLQWTDVDFENMSLQVKRTFLGKYKGENTANIYSHVLPSMSREASQKMNDAFRKRSQ